MIYIDNAATSRYKPLKVMLASAKELMKSANPGRAGHKDSISSAIKIEETRLLIQDLIGEGNVIFTKNCTEALNIAILHSGLSGEVITTQLEHNSVYRPLTKLKNENKIKIKIAPSDENGYVSPSTISKLINSGTSMVIINEVSNVLGVKQPIENIALETKSKGVKLLIDCAQSIGHTKTNYKDVDIICCSGHKGLHGPQGTGFLWFKDNIKLKPLIYGGTGTNGFDLTQPYIVPEGFESGTLNTMGIVGLSEGVKWTKNNLDGIITHIDKLTDRLYNGLRNINGIKLYNKGKISSGVVLFNVNSLNSSSVADILSNEYNIAVRSGLHCAPLAHSFLKTTDSGAVRASIGYNNSDKDIDKLITAIDDISRR